MSRKALDALGSQRDSLSSNPLLISSEVGKPRSRCFSLPPAEFTFGVRTCRLDGGAAEALSTWHQLHSKSLRKKEPGKDFIALNRLAAQSGLTSAHEQTQFRACNDIRRRDDDKKDCKQVRPFPDDITFGITTRPSTPLFDLLENRYQQRWLNEMKDSERKQRQEIFRKKLHGKVYETRASLLRRYPEPIEPPPYWKMSRFTNIPPAINTFRAKNHRERAHTYHQSDRASRQGMIGQGIYQTS